MANPTRRSKPTRVSRLLSMSSLSEIFLLHVCLRNIFIIKLLKQEEATSLVIQVLHLFELVC